MRSMHFFYNWKVVSIGKCSHRSMVMTLYHVIQAIYRWAIQQMLRD
uniref:RNA-directed DNA polymerase n=1 Tax=Ascaris lumbricoides TaxID=6252 RepID=A0A0M3HKR9_ASCLU